ncbi:MAG: hypothetical protein J4224_02760 [Candidatus Diapherotrites archaeon]|uniref:Translation elongation factor EF1B beta/delta subunit guanine nucleotide exchange domain-containing protein n=1 Tax=Candidatus Iainarchaeum sp. TaxID=3101447 RepID=A0A7J4IVD1_9ARCH|nr:MAG: hypothetical protein QT03_C0001G1187 [archaeon GW2011_AR10]MBS3059323.1 hypothetical protein [Candidatus Diapherotrites archaeon]HIH08195.1 hypothetical protein [Candidatus Diapherotrites archaeon]
MVGSTFAVFKVIPKDPEKLAETEQDLRQLKNCKVKDVKREPIGFGIEVLKLGVLVPEKDEMAIEDVTSKIKALKTVEDAELEQMTLL